MELRCVAARCGRLSSFLKGELAMSTGLMNRLKWGDAIRVNGNPEHTDYPVQPGDIITVAMEEETPEYPAEDGPVSVLYEDEWILAVDKPAGMLIHPSRSHFSGTLANYVMGYYRRTEQQCAFHPLTRLDRDTYGIVLLGKNSHIHSLLQAAKPQKIYHAVVFGEPPADSGEVNAPIARRPLPSLLREIHPQGKPCLTEYRVLERRGQTAKLALTPITGRTHQLRLHCAHMGCPIVGDPQYGTAESVAWSEQRGITSQLLCARELHFTHPITGEEMHLQSRLDAEI